MKITCIVGLPGSGKTTLGNQLADGLWLDDISVIGGLSLLKDAINYGWESIIVSDVFLCRPIDRLMQSDG
jgi:broad-specificity NMP kinase